MCNFANRSCWFGGFVPPLLLVLSKRDRKEESLDRPVERRTGRTIPRRRVPARLLFQISISSSKGGRDRWQAAQMHKVAAVRGNDSKLSRAGGAMYVKSTYSYFAIEIPWQISGNNSGEIVEGETCSGNIYIYVYILWNMKKYMCTYIFRINFLEKSFSSRYFRFK